MKKVKDAQLQSNEAANQSGKRDTNAAAQLAKSHRGSLDVEKDAMKAAHRFTFLQRKLNKREKGTDGALKRCTEMLRRTGLLNCKAFVLMWQLINMKKARYALVSGSNV